MKKINEIFYSLQGEGYHVGTPVVFVRFSGCNLKCSFCDTQHEEGEMMTDDAILKVIARYPSKTVVLTGGEPSLFIDDAFVELLHQEGLKVYIETNGTHVLPKTIDWVSCSPKSGGKVVLDSIDELKVVYQGQDIEPYEKIVAKNYFLQPCSGENIPETIECVLQHPKWRLSLQTHKLIDIR